MLDQDMIDQLKTVFEPLQKQIDLVYVESDHADQASLAEMLQGLERASSKIKARRDINMSGKGLPPQFRIDVDGKATGVFFKGIPGGHEFTSLVVAILNAGGLGKLPDESLKSRVQSLKGPIDIKTYISLTCENCPDVVQAMNQMALIHGNFKHQMIDGAYVQEEITSLGIQGVPSVVIDGKLFHSGKINFLDLLGKLEAHFGSEKSEQGNQVRDLGQFDVVVVGGGPAGASAAIYSVRKGLSTAIIAERFGGQVQDTKGIENLISVPYTEGPQLAAQLSQHMSAYPIKMLEHRRVSKIDRENKVIHLEGGEVIKASTIIIATGAKWRELGVPGEKEYMGRGVAYCPHCDGPYYKGKKVAVVGGGNSGVEAAIDLAGIVKEVVLFEFNSELKADKILVDKLKSMPNTSIITNAKTTEVLGDGHKVNALQYVDQVSKETKKEDLDGVFVQIGLLPNSGFAKDVVETNKFGEIVVDLKGRTSVKGIYAAGDVTTTPFKQIIIAMGEGAKAALTAFEDKMYHT